MIVLLQVEGEVQYNGRGFDEFIVQRTAGYVQQVDVHIGEMTVRETLNYAAQFQVGFAGEEWEGEWVGEGYLLGSMGFLHGSQASCLCS